MLIDSHRLVICGIIGVDTLTHFIVLSCMCC
jgi:hypothetical protein